MRFQLFAPKRGGSDRYAYVLMMVSIRLTAVRAGWNGVRHNSEQQVGTALA